MSFLRKFLKLNAGTEVPEQFALWSAIAGISAALGRRVWYHAGNHNVFPNIYVVLIAGSGRCKKSTAINVIKYMLMEIPDINLMPQMASPQGMIDRLSGREGSADQDKREFIAEEAVGFLIEDELKTFLNKRSYEQNIAPTLVKFFDCEKSFEEATRGRGRNVLKNTCLGMLGGSTVEWIREALPMEAIGGGLTSRMVFIYTDEPQKPVPRPTSPEWKEPLEMELLEELRAITELNGAVSFTKEGGELYDEIYNKFWHESLMFEDPYLSGYASRRNALLQKLAIIVSVSETGKLILDENAIKAALDLLKVAELSMPRVMRLITASEEGVAVEMIFGAIRRRGPISKGELVRLYSHRFGLKEVEAILETLVVSNLVEAQSGSKSIMYRLKEH